MNYLISASTDVGIKKSTNQDSLTVKVIDTSIGKCVYAVICDGMGGLEKGELASATVIKAFAGWFSKHCNVFSSNQFSDTFIRREWENVILEQNQKIKNYGIRVGIELGTTVTVLFLTPSRYYIGHVGDSRAYEMTNRVRQLTEDQTFVAREIKLGKMTVEEASVDPRRNVLLQCVGASNIVTPEFYFGTTVQNAVYMLCSDGFRHMISSDEIYSVLNPSKLLDQSSMKSNEEYLIELNKQRQETDNISVVTIRTY